ncbi:MAG: M1 family metallopeptidase [Saprospiraceae bacterium]|nr:M1 family metallopeptidase [Saprospiraceae bacterium]
MNLYTTFAYCLATFILFSCGQSKVLTEDPVPTFSDVEIRNLDTLVISAPAMESDGQATPAENPVYRATPTRLIDLLHTSLDLRFDWQSEKVIGTAKLKFHAYWHPIEKAILDAKGFEINEVRNLNTGQALDFDYDGEQLNIDLGRSCPREDTLDIQIDYIAAPSKSAGHDGGAISSDQGLFFINPRGADGNKPSQIWTQGETEFNSRWFPTVDKPNERCTQETYLTVDEKYTTLSNGLLQSSTTNGDGTRTDHWIMNQPHAPYLFMVAVGEYTVVKDKWNDIEVTYYVEPEFENDARSIFAHTPEMLTFFSDLTGIQYPWDKYAQIVVRDYVSGAMENTTSVIYGEFVQRTKRELIDQSNDMIVAHELFHHWFGDYVTCESWANLTMNEGFANYSEYLWSEYKYGRDAADYHRQQELSGYLFQAQQEVHPLIHFSYDDKEDMFDQHSYNKGGLVLHMLRHYMGDDAFFRALKLYLQENALSAVEVHDLRLACEEVLGEDLNWFFNQWFLASGHPLLEVSDDWSDSSSMLNVIVEQRQDVTQNHPIFIIPTEIEIIYPDGTRERKQVSIDERIERLQFPLIEKPAAIVLDPSRIQLALIQSDYNDTEQTILYQHGHSLGVRSAAADYLLATSTKMDAKIMSILNDPFWSIRLNALDGISWQGLDTAWVQQLAEMAKHDSHSFVRARALELLGELGLDSYKDIVSTAINNHDPYPVVAAAIVALHQMDPDLCAEKITVIRADKNTDIIAAISVIYALAGDTSNLSYFATHLEDVSGLSAMSFYGQLEVLLSELPFVDKLGWMEMLAEVAVKTNLDPYTRMAATRTIISSLKGVEAGRSGSEESATFRSKTNSLIEEIINKEPNAQIRSIYRTMLDL